MSVIRVASIYRHLVKGFNQESLEEAQFVEGASLLGDRAFAFQFLDTPLAASAENSPWVSKFSLAMQHDWPDLANIIPTWNDDRKELSLNNLKTSKCITATVTTSEGRAELATFVFDYLKTLSPFAKARHPVGGPVQLIGNADLSTRYTDGDKGPVSFALKESLYDLESKFGHTVDERRFRLNLFLEGAPAWSELAWTDKKIKMGGCILQVYKPIGRCPNIDVDQDSGIRKDEIFPQLKTVLGHTLFGIKANVLKGGIIKIGDTWELLD